MTSGNGRVPNANQRARTLERQTATAEQSLAQVIARAVAEVLGGMLPGALHQALAGQAWQPGCLYCVNAHKHAMAAHAAAVAAAQEAGEDASPPPPAMIQQAITTCPLQPGPNMPPVPVPVCYDHFQPQEAARPTGLVGPDGSPIVARAA